MPLYTTIYYDVNSNLTSIECDSNEELKIIQRILDSVGYDYKSGFCFNKNTLISLLEEKKVVSSLLDSQEQ